MMKRSEFFAAIDAAGRALAPLKAGERARCVEATMKERQLPWVASFEKEESYHIVTPVMAVANSPEAPMTLGLLVLFERAWETYEKLMSHPREVAA